MRLASITLVVAIGCGDNQQLPVGIHNGTRLFARSYVAGDAAVFRHWHDAQLDIDCTFQVGADARYYCLPIVSAIGYSDPGCTQAEVSVQPCATVPRFVVGPYQSLAACPIDRGVRAYAVGETTGAYYYDIGMGCALGVNGSGGELHTTSEVPLATFVAAELVRGQTGAAIETYGFLADDGASQSDSTWDTARDAECTINGDAPRCHPTEIAIDYANLWADATCAGVHAAADLDRIRPCAHASAGIGLGGDHVTFSELGATIAVAYDDGNGACAAAAVEADVVYYQQGAPIAESQFPAATRILDGTGRIRASRYEQTPGVPLAMAVTLYDTSYAEPCNPQPWSDDTLRCVPQDSATAGAVFSDTACAHPVAALGSGGPLPRVIVVASKEPACDGNTRYDQAFAPGGAYTGPLYANPSCLPMQRDPAATYVSLGDPIDLPQIDEP